MTVTGTLAGAGQLAGLVPCAACGGETVDVLHLDEVPALCNYFWATADDARRAPRGTVRLTFCDRCDLLSNSAFQDGLVSYTASYENSIHFSTTFDAYARGLAERLVTRYGLHGKRIVEIGCGSGDFLALLARFGPNVGVGFDPSHDAGRAPAPAGVGEFEIRPTAFPEDGLDADFVVARHVLEHVPDPLGMLAAMRRSIGDRAGAVVYVEVPDATYMLAEPAIWDVIHEHCSYFTDPCLRRLVERAGFTVLDSGRSLGDQYLWVEAAPAPVPPPAPARLGPTPTGDLVTTFQAAFGRTVDTWRARLEEFGAERTAIWGAGAKGVMFLNLVDPLGRIAGVVDVNPHKQGRFVPVTGQQIVSAETLATTRPEHVIVMNPLFQDEIAAALDHLGIAAEVATA